MNSNATGFTQLTEFVRVPSLIQAFECGFSKQLFDEGMEYISIPKNMIGNVRDPYVIRVEGDSMEPEIPDGRILIVDHDTSPRHKDIIACVLNGQCIVKQYIVNNFSTILRSYNPDYDDRRLNKDDDYHYLGRVAVSMKVY